MTAEDETLNVSEMEGFTTTTFTSTVRLSVGRPRPYLVQYEERCGRLLVAGRDIKAGEIILRDPAAALGPDNNPRPVCLVCLARLVSGQVVTCQGCGWPLCSVKCRDNIGHHARECHLFQTNGTKFDVTQLKTTCPSYNAIMVLRLLWLKENEPETWEMIDMLMDHKEENMKKLSPTEETVISFVRSHCQLSQFSRSLILHVMGIIDTNAYIIGENQNKNVDIQGLFPTTSIINHSCRGNTMCFATDSWEMACRAVVDIKQGEEITTNYLYHQYHVYGLTYRAEELQSYWHFSCSCARCGDRSELGSFVDSVFCSHCGQPRLTPSDPDYSTKPWTCLNTNCRHSQPANKIAGVLNTAWNNMQENTWLDTDTILNHLSSLQDVFHSEHYIVLEMKRKFIELIGNHKYGYETVTGDLLARKVSFCRDHLKIQSVLSPGLSEYRAYISLHLAEALYWGVQRHVIMEDSHLIPELLKVVVDIWGQYRSGSSEKTKAQEAEDLLRKFKSQKENSDVSNTKELEMRKLA